MKLLKYLLYLVLAVALFVVVAGLFAKKNYRIERSMDIKAPKSIVFDQLSKYKNFNKWSPWSPLDPKMVTSIEGTDGQVGAVYKWSGNKDVGKGSMTMTAISENKIEQLVKFAEPWESSSPTFYTLEENGKTVKTSWGMDVTIPFPMNGLAMFTDVNKAIGTDFENGLSNLKKVCEEIASKRYGGYDVVESEMPVRYYSGIRSVVPISQMDSFFQVTMPKAFQLTEKAGGEIAGPPAAIFWTYDTIAMKSDLATAMPLAKQQKLGGGVQVFTVGGKKALTIDYYGPYAGTEKAHKGLEEYMAEKGYTTVMPCMEEYITDPMTEKDTMKWLTKVTYFLDK